MDLSQSSQEAFPARHAEPSPEPQLVFQAWRDRADALAEWTFTYLVNRTEVWGGYRPLHLRDSTIANGKIWTKPARCDRGSKLLTPAIIARHYLAYDVGQVIGLHSTSPENTSRWCFVDIDWHNESSPPPELNWFAALYFYQKLVNLQLRPLLIDSNGAGGFHLGVIFSEPVVTSIAFAFLRWLVGDYRNCGLSSPPEIFPKQESISPGRYGNWLRLPGRHHTRNHWSRIWDGQRWLEGAEAIDFLLSLRGDPPSKIPNRCFAIEQPSASSASNERPLQRGNPIRPGGLARRISGYVAKLPNLSEGQGRDDVAFNFAAFLVRDLQLPDDQALSWLSHWDSGNSPPKGEDRLREIIASAHRYGRNAYGSGLSTCLNSQKLQIPQWKKLPKVSSIQRVIQP